MGRTDHPDDAKSLDVLVVAGGQGSPGRDRPEPTAAEALTWRELDVLQLMDEHHTNKDIARLLYISEETVKKHAQHIYGKLQANGRRDAVIRAYALGILRVEDRRIPRPV